MSYTMMLTTTVEGANTKKRMRRRNMRQFIPLYFMMVPGLVYLLINNYLPLFGLTIAFKDVNYTKGILGSDWVGLKNFRFLFQTKDAWIITRNTILYNVVFIVVNTVLAIIIAILLEQITQKIFSKIFQTVLILPSLVSMIIISYLAYAFLSSDNGFVNSVILPGLGLEQVSWYSTPNAWPFILVFINAWKGVGQMSIIYFAAVIGINREYHEAAMLDGASFIQRVFHITLPQMRSVIITMVLLAIGKIFYSDFGLFYQVTMNSGMLYSTKSTIDTYVYRGLIQLGDIGMSSAAGFYQSIVGFILVLGSNLIVRHFDPENALF